MKRLKFWRTRLRGIPQHGTHNFSQALVLPDIFNRSNFEYSTFSSLKVDSGRKKKKKEKTKKQNKKNSFQGRVNEHNQKKDN